jgi:putative addiction module killer protein
MGEDVGLSVRTYFTEDGRDPIKEWLKALRDPLGKRAVIRRIDRLMTGHFGDHRPVRDGVWELRIHTGPGYRVYYAMDGSIMVLLLAAGDKSTQTRDVDRAVDCWHDWCRRKPEP